MEKIMISLRKMFMIAVFVFFGSIAFADNLTEDFDEACSLYKNGSYELALEKFLSLEKMSPSDSIYYNIGNAYYRLGKVGNAMVYYARAEKISPYDEDIEFNIKHISMMIDEKDYETSNFAKLKIHYCFFIFALVSFIFSLVLSIKIARPGIRVFWPFLISLMLFIMGFWIYTWRFVRAKEHVAVILKNNAEVRTGPDESFKISAVLPEGKKVLVIRKSSDWIEIGIKSLAIKGWLPSRELEII
ncbi:MAG: Tetratricopeptide repeat protein [Elusimicrobia bacterium ADurb.Bin231]|nr:MAG: Tetratricopeptide repeat protein [Elusimicrobia bacterium ADurb.Bin231]